MRIEIPPAESEREGSILSEGKIGELEQLEDNEEIRSPNKRLHRVREARSGRENQEKLQGGRRAG